jgi:voltage-gated potassium channel
VSASAGRSFEASHEARRGFRRVFVTLLGALGSTAALVAIYYLLPLDRSSIGVVIGILAVGLLALVGLVALQVRAIIRSPYPVLRAVGALATSVPLFLLLFAGTYFVMATISAGTFSQPMTRTDALYFTVTVFSTVGFGDITAVTEPARVLVIGQMLADIVILGLGARIIVDAVKRGQQRPAIHAGDAAPAAD